MQAADIAADTAAELPPYPLRDDGWGELPVGPLPDFTRPAAEQGIVIVDVFGTPVAVPRMDLERLIAYNRGCPANNPKKTKKAEDGPCLPNLS